MFLTRPVPQDHRRLTMTVGGEERNDVVMIRTAAAAVAENDFDEEDETVTLSSASTVVPAPRSAKRKDQIEEDEGPPGKVFQTKASLPTFRRYGLSFFRSRKACLLPEKSPFS